eukprot:4918945-Pyramimonas_sp.AAC.1
MGPPLLIDGLHNGLQDHPGFSGQHQEGPKRAPGGPQEGPKIPQRVPRGPQHPPHETHGLRGSRKRTGGGPQTTPTWLSESSSSSSSCLSFSSSPSSLGLPTSRSRAVSANNFALPRRLPREKRLGSARNPWARQD